MKSKFFRIGAMALSLLATCGSLTSCYEKEDITTVIDNTPKAVTYVISGSVHNSNNLTGIVGAMVTLTKDNVAVTNGAATTNGQGEFGITLSKLTEKDRGAYSLKVEAKGYQTRYTQFNIEFEAANNQTIATHMDFAMKASAIQGSVEEIVAGATDQTITIDGSSADGNGTVTDQITVPAGAFGEGIVKTITIMRESLSSEAALSAARIYEGKPDGTVFVKPLTLTFDYPDALVSKEEGLKVLFKKADGTWAEDNREGKVNSVKKVSENKYEASIYHFSQFMIGQAPISGSEDGTSNKYATNKISSELPVIGIDKYHNSSNTSKDFDIEFRKLKFGSKYETSLSDVFTAIADPTAKAIALFQAKEYIDRIMEKNAPAADFILKNEVYPIKADAHSDVLSITPTQTVINWTITMTFAGKSYVIKVANINEYSFKANCQDYTHGHGIGHGHGHGGDLNAGGGIIDFE